MNRRRKEEEKDRETVEFHPSKLKLCVWWCAAEDRRRRQEWLSDHAHLMLLCFDAYL